MLYCKVVVMNILKAIDGSIDKWEGIVYHNNKELGAFDCPLCTIFNSPSLGSSVNCIGCPICKHKKYQYCQNTPYSRYLNYKEICCYEIENILQMEFRRRQKDKRFMKSLENDMLTFLYEVRLDFIRRIFYGKRTIPGNKSKN